jgi:hypothetical protein
MMEALSAGDPYPSLEEVEESSLVEVEESTVVDVDELELDDELDELDDELVLDVDDVGGGGVIGVRPRARDRKAAI